MPAGAEASAEWDGVGLGGHGRITYAGAKVTAAGPKLEAIMGERLRRVRGAIGMGFTWGAAWSAAGVVLAAATRFAADAPFPLIFGVLGFFAGVIFSAFLALTEGRRRFDQMSLSRFAAWGAAGGLLLSAVFA